MHGRRSLIIVVALVAGCSDGAPAAPDAGNLRDQCVGSADLAILAPFMADGGLVTSDSFNALFDNCARNFCTSELVTGTEAEAEACLSDCLADSEIAGLTEGCEDCMVLQVLCGMDNCTLPCLGTDPDLCASCIGENCLPSRDYCTGIPSVP